MPDDFRPVSQWPRLLAGPMVRRVANNRAHIFVATKMACQAHVVLYSGRQSHSGPATEIATGTPASLNRIGQRLFIGVLAVDIPLSQTPGSTVSYDVIINDGIERGLSQLGLLGGSAATDPRRREFPLGYDEGMLPSFVLPPDDPEDLRIVHASCRKPHGGGSTEADAIQLLDAAIKHSIDGTSPADNRPQQLILTGDQIYADDVAPALLQALTGAGNALLGWDETLPVIDAHSVLNFMVDPGWRTRYLSIRDVDIKEIPEEDVTDYSQSHLLRFGEWVAMYLFAWSDALWATERDDLGPVGDYHLPDHPAVLPIARATAIANDVLGLADRLGIVVVSARVARIAQIATDLADKLTRHSRKINEFWDETHPKALRYGMAVRSVRRALANCATYMMFDDHEITDDWYVSKRVHDRLKGNSQPSPKGDIGPRLLRNGLSAYAFFQHWGNVPDDFASGTRGRQLLDMWRFNGTTSACAMKQTPRGGDTLLGIESGDSPIPASGARGDFVRMRWDYAVAFPTHRLIALDTRTWRFFPTGNPLSWTDLAPHIPNPSGSAASSGAAELTACANAWRQAGTQANVIVMQHFAALIDDYVGFASATNESLDQLKSRTVTFGTHYFNFLDTLPGRAAIAAAQQTDPFSSWLHDLVRDPTSIAAFIDAMDFTVERLREFVLELMRTMTEYDFGPLGYAFESVFEALADFVDTAWSGSVVGMAHSAKRAVENAGSDLWNLFTSTATSHSAFANLNTALVAALNALDALTRATGLDDLGRAIFRSGDNRIAPGLIREQALPFMVTRPLQTVGPSVPISFFLSPAPIFGNRLVEIAQRLSVIKQIAAGNAGEEEMDFEPWSANIPAMIDLFEAVQGPGCAIVLSGDVHYAGSSVVRAITATSSRRYIQFTSSSARNSDGKTRALGRLDDLLYDESGTVFFEQADWTSLMDHGSSSLAHLRQLAWARVVDGFHDAIEAPGDAYDSIRTSFHEFLNTDFNPQAVVDLVGRVLSAQPNTLRVLATEAAWQIFSAIETIQEFHDDPMLKIFGDFLSAPAPLRHSLRNFYAFVELDPVNGLRLEETVLVDRRSPRLSLYPVSSRVRPGTRTDTEAMQRRTVGHANAGFISFVMRGDDIKEVVHELRWYPDDEAATGDPIPRVDWYGTLHRAGWCGSPIDPARHRP